MSSTLTLVLISILVFFLIFPLLFYLRRRVELSIEEDLLVLKYPFKTKRIDLEKELESWEVQEAYYIRWGVFHSINMRFKSGKRITVSSLFNQENYDLLFDHLSKNFPERIKVEHPTGL